MTQSGDLIKFVKEKEEECWQVQLIEMAEVRNDPQGDCMARRWEVCSLSKVQAVRRGGIIGSVGSRECEILQGRKENFRAPERGTGAVLYDLLVS